MFELKYDPFENGIWKMTAICSGCIVLTFVVLKPKYSRQTRGLPLNSSKFPEAEKPGHQYLQCWFKIYNTEPVSYKDNTFSTNNIIHKIIFF